MKGEHPECPMCLQDRKEISAAEEVCADRELCEVRSKNVWKADHSGLHQDPMQGEQGVISGLRAGKWYDLT